MNKETIIQNSKEKFRGKLLDIVLSQIDNYFELDNLGNVINNPYKIGDDVKLTKNHLLHGIGSHTDIINTFAERGILSPDFLGTNINHAFCYTSAFWNVKENITLKKYVENYSGIVAKINKEYYQVPYKKIDEFVEKIRVVDHWLWTAESSMEIRFMPSLARDINQVGFIVNMENELCKRLRQNSVFSESFNKEYALEFVNEKSKDKFLKKGFKEDYFQRADYLILGVPKNVIEGIIVGRILERNQENLNKIKELFPNCYICNLEGKVIA